MFSSTMIGFLLGIGVAAWVYSKMMRRTGGNTKSAATIAAISGFIAFIMALIILMTITSYLGD